MLYFLLKLIFRAALKVFYRRIEVERAHLIPAQGPLLVVSNHPNTFMDPIVIASLLPQQVYFIAKSTVFNTSFKKWLLHQMNLIPVHRREDGAVTPGGNDATFRKCYEFLNARGTLLIFPEGNSFNERRLRPLKTGAARIALGAAAQRNFTPEVFILPIGLHYADPTRFRSKVLVNVAAPIAVSAYAALYQQDPAATFRALTNQMRVALEAQVIHTASDEDEELINQIEIIYKSRLLAEAGGENAGPAEEFALTQRLVESLQYYKTREPERVRRIRQQMATYLRALERLNLKDWFFYDRHGNRYLSGWLLQSVVFSVLGLPVYLFGLITNYLPYILPAKVAAALTEEAEFIAPILMTTGIFTFTFFYVLELYLVWHGTQSLLFTVLFALSLPVAGFFTLHYYRKLTHTIAHFRLLALFFKKSRLVADLMQQRHAIIEELEQARRQYLRDAPADAV